MPGAGLAKATHKNPNCKEIVFIGGIFLDNTISSSILDAISSKTTHSDDPHFSISYQKKKPLFKFPAVKGGDFLCVGLSIRSKNGLVENSNQFLWFNGVERSCKEEALVEPNGVGDIEDEGNKQKVQLRDSGRGAVNTTKHLWAGAVAAMVSRHMLQLFCFVLS